MTGINLSLGTQQFQGGPSGSSHVLLARHGQTAMNAAGRLRGLADPPLDAAGVTEAALLGKHLAQCAPREVRCSPLQRAVATARTVAAAAGLTAVIDGRLNDRDYGPWTGHLKSDVEDEWGSTDLAPGVEPTARILERAWPVLEEAATHPGVTVLITHDAVIRPLLTRLLGAPPDHDTQTAHWNELSFSGGTWSVDRIDVGPTG